MNELVLTGLDAKNPIAFMAALGVLDALADRAKAPAPEPRLAFRTSGIFQPVLVNSPERDAIVDLLMDDLASFRNEPAILRLRYAKHDGKIAHDLKPPKGFYADYLRALVSGGTPRSLVFAAAFATDVVVDNNGNTKPTALHFTAGQQEFLAMVATLIESITADDLLEALFGPWRYSRSLPVLQWDNSGARDYALRANDPSKEKKQGVPGADWLAFRGLSYFPVAPDAKGRLHTTGCQGGWKAGAFRWPLWSVPLTGRAARSVVASTDLLDVQPHVLRERGVDVVFEAGIRRTDQGGYGSFTPARIAESGGRQS